MCLRNCVQWHSLTNVQRKITQVRSTSLLMQRLWMFRIIDFNDIPALAAFWKCIHFLTWQYCFSYEVEFFAETSIKALSLSQVTHISQHVNFFSQYLGTQDCISSCVAVLWCSHHKHSHLNFQEKQLRSPLHHPPVSLKKMSYKFQKR